MINEMRHALKIVNKIRQNLNQTLKEVFIIDT